MVGKAQCPLCGQNQVAILRTYAIRRLAKIWKRKVKFDPFLGADHAAELEKLTCIECGLIFYRPEIIGDSAFYGKLSKFDWYYESDKWEFDRALSLIAEFKPNSVLEVGCGSGEFLHRIVGCVDTVLGLDINQSALSRARAKGLDVSDRHVSELDRCFDMICLFQVLEHLESPREFVSALVDRLNPGGCLVLAVPNPAGFMKHLDVVFLDMPPHHNTCWPKDALSYLAELSKLQVVHYEAEPLKYEYFRSLLLNQIVQSQTWRIIKLAQMTVSLLLAPSLYAARSQERCDGQTHLVVMRKAEVG